MADCEEELKSKVGLKLNIQKKKITASDPITSWQIDGEKVETVADFILWDSKITADSDCSHGAKRCLLLERKAMINLDRVLKTRDITLLTKAWRVKAMVFPIVMYGWESWTIKKAKDWRVKAFELRCWQRLLTVPWTARGSNQCNRKKINPEHSMKGLMLKLKLQYFGRLMRRADSLEKTLMLGKKKAEGERGDRRWDGWITSLTQWTWLWANSRR